MRPISGASALLIAAGWLGLAAPDARAQQYVVAPGSPVIVAPAPPAVVGGTYYVQPTRTFRRFGRYNVQRPTYNVRPGLTFAPYSDRYLARPVQPQTFYYPATPR